MSNTVKHPPKFSIDMSQNKYSTRYDRLMNILYYSTELPSDLYLHMNMSCENYRKAIQILKQRRLIKSLRKGGKTGYVLGLAGKKLICHANYMKYSECIDDIKRQYDAAHRMRKFQFAYLYALFDRVGIPYETFAKPPLSNDVVNENAVYFYTAVDLKRMLGMDATSFKGSRVMGFLIGKGKIIAVYRTNQMIKSFSSVEKLIPFFMLRYFRVRVETAIIICNDNEAVSSMTEQLYDSYRNKEKTGLNTAQYKYFYLFPSDDSFLSRFEDLYADHTAAEHRVIQRYGIDTSDRDHDGRRRIMSGTGYLYDSPILICTGNVNAVDLNRFIFCAVFNDLFSYILCQQRDLKALQKATSNYPIEVLPIHETVIPPARGYPT